MLLRFQGVGVDPEQIRHQFGATPIGIPEMLRCAKGFGLKARSLTTKWERLANTPLPGIAALRDGSFLLLGKASEDKIIVQAPDSPRPTLMTRAEFEAVWDGRLVLMTKRAAPHRSGAPVRHHLVPGRDPQVSPSAERGAGRLVLPPALCAGVAAVLPGRHRQGARASQHEHARRAGDRPRRDRPVRDDPGDPAHLSVFPHDQSDRCRTRGAAVSALAGAADRLFPGKAGRRLGRPRARA